MSEMEKMNGKTLAELAQLVDGKVEGDPGTRIYGVSGIKEARPGEITFLANGKYRKLLDKTSASAVVVEPGIESSSRPLLKVTHPDLAFAQIVECFVPSQRIVARGLHPTAVVDPSARLGENVCVGAHVVVEAEASVGARTVLYPGCYVGHGTVVGEDCLIYPRVVIRERVTLGNRLVIHSGVVIGSDGFGFAELEGVYHKIPQAGTVVIEDDVELGANTTIDRARFHETRIGRGTKLDNLVMVAHNVEIGENTVIAAQTGIAGSTRVGRNCMFAGQVGIVGHVEIGDQVRIGAGGGISKSLPPGGTWWGSPAKPIEQARRIEAVLRHLPEKAKSLRECRILLEELLERVSRLEASAENARETG